MERRVIHVEGLVQGVGLRPFVHQLASRLRLFGSVNNRGGALHIEIEGVPSDLDSFLGELVQRPPPLARIERIAWTRESPRGEAGFSICSSRADGLGPVRIPADVAPCDECLAEISDPSDRRYRYPFTNCTNCGPRLTIIAGAPYDRPRTTMAGFAMCSACRNEYENPADRRFHAQPIACPRCGPRLSLLDRNGAHLPAEMPLAAFAAHLRSGGIGALKGLGGYHLVCDARRDEAVAELRRRKHREEKPLALMLADTAAAAQICEVSEVEGELLRSARRPIVLLRRRSESGGPRIASSVAPANPLLGVVLPYTPLHHLLMDELGGVPLVMTSGNRSDEPIAFRDDDAVERLHGIADAFLTHNRPIRVRCDDSVTRVVAGEELPIRRSRGDAPQPIPLPVTAAAPILAVGGQLKATFGLAQGPHAILSHHLGDLDHLEAWRAFEKDVALLEELFAVAPRWIAHDLHPDYASTRYARKRAEREGLAAVAVQHHHAHMASAMAEHGLIGPVVGVTFDGTGFGTDGAIWGGEFLIGDYRQFRRAAHLRYVGMPGGDRAIREPWRMAAAWLRDAGCGSAVRRLGLPPESTSTVERMLERRINAPDTSSMGRLFDAVAAIVGVRNRVSYEGQAAMELEGLAAETDERRSYPFDVTGPAGSASQKPLIVDPRPMVRALVTDVQRGIDRRQIARMFHRTVARMIRDVCRRLRSAGGPNRVVLSGGVFLNAMLTVDTLEWLRDDGFQVYRHRLVPPNDGGLSLGQLAVVAARTSVSAGAQNESETVNHMTR